MRTRFLAIPLALLLALASAGVAAADTTPGGDGADGLDVAVTAVAVNPRTGLVTVSGTVTCVEAFDWVGVDVNLAQLVGRLVTVRGWGWTGLEGCEAESTASFSASFYADSGRFAPGRATLEIFAWGEGGCVDTPDDYYCGNEGWASHGPMSVRLQAQR